MKSAIDVLDAVENIRRAHRAGVYAPHKPLLILLALARVQRGEPRLVEFTIVDEQLKQLLAEFGPSSADNPWAFCMAPRSPRSSARGSLLVSTFCLGWHQPLGWSASFKQRRVIISSRLFYLSEKRAIFRT